MRKFVVVSLILFLFAGVAHASVNGTFEGNQIVKVFSSGKEIEAQNVPAVLLNGRTMVPIYMLRDLGADVTWDQETYSVNVELPVQTVVQQTQQQSQGVDIAKLAKEAKPYGVDFVGYFDDGSGTSQIKYYLGENLFEFEKDLNKWGYVTTTGAYTGATFLEIEDNQGNTFNVPTKALRDYYDGIITAEQLVSQYEVYESAANTVPIQPAPIYDVPPAQPTYEPVYQETPIYDNARVCEDIRSYWALEIANAPKGGTVGKVQWEIKQRELARDQELAAAGCN